MCQNLTSIDLKHSYLKLLFYPFIWLEGEKLEAGLGFRGNRLPVKRQNHCLPFAQAKEKGSINDPLPYDMKLSAVWLFSAATCL